MQQRGHRAAHAAGFIGIVRQAGRHEQAAKIRVSQPQRPEQVAVPGDVRRRIAGMIDEDFLRDEVDPRSGLEPLRIERAIRPAKLHQVDARQIARRIVEEHVLRAVVHDDAVGDEMARHRLCQIEHVLFAARHQRCHAIDPADRAYAVTLRFNSPSRSACDAFCHESDLFLEAHARCSRNSQRVHLLTAYSRDAAVAIGQYRDGLPERAAIRIELGLDAEAQSSSCTCRKQLDDWCCPSRRTETSRRSWHTVPSVVNNPRRIACHGSVGRVQTQRRSTASPAEPASSTAYSRIFANTAPNRRANAHAGGQSV